MTHWAKFSRANDHLADIDSVIRHFLDMKPYRFIIEYDPKPPYPPGTERASCTIRLHAPLFPPTELPVLIGDFLTNLRASLDHLVYGIALRHATAISAEKLAKQRGLQFPIYDDAARFSAWRGKVKDYLPDVVLNILDGFQPYKGWNGDPSALILHHRLSRLWVLNALVNADKHRALMPVTQLRFNGVAIRAHLPGVSPGPIAGGIIHGSYEHGNEIAKLFFPASPDAEVDIPDDFAKDVAFSEEWPAHRMPVSELLHYLADYVRDEAFPALEPYL